MYLSSNTIYNLPDAVIGIIFTVSVAYKNRVSYVRHEQKHITNILHRNRSQLIQPIGLKGKKNKTEKPFIRAWSTVRTQRGLA